MKPEFDLRGLLADYRAATTHAAPVVDASLRQAVGRIRAGEHVAALEALAEPARAASPLLRVLHGGGGIGALVVAAVLLGSTPPASGPSDATVTEAKPVLGSIDPTVQPVPPVPPVPPVLSAAAKRPEPPSPAPSLVEEAPAPAPKNARAKRGPRPATKQVGTEAERAAAEALDEEIRLMGKARRALGRGQPSEALAVLRDHQRRYPSGQLREDRDASIVTALCQLGREREARAVASPSESGWPACPSRGAQ